MIEARSLGLHFDRHDPRRGWNLTDLDQDNPFVINR